MMSLKSAMWISVSVAALSLGCDRGANVQVSSAPPPAPPPPGAQPVQSAQPAPAATPLPPVPAEPQEATYEEAPDDETYIDQPPPAPLVEVVPVAPGPDFVWIGGYWGWDNGHHNYQWVRGHYDRPPAPGAAWVGPRYDRAPRGYHFSPGHWSGQAAPAGHADGKKG
jgi:hypothetical protein